MKTPNEEFFVISGTLAQTILGYLLRCPAGEVWNMVEGLRGLPRAQITPPPPVVETGQSIGQSLASEGT